MHCISAFKHGRGRGLKAKSGLLLCLQLLEIVQQNCRWSQTPWFRELTPRTWPATRWGLPGQLENDLQLVVSCFNLTPHNEQRYVCTSCRSRACEDMKDLPDSGTGMIDLKNNSGSGLLMANFLIKMDGSAYTTKTLLCKCIPHMNLCNIP